MFRDRIEAARLLAGGLVAWRGRRPLILGVPRGGVPMARVIADSLGGDLDVVLVHKIGAPGQPEFAIGAVDESGAMWLDERLASLGIPRDAAESGAAQQFEILSRRRALYTPVRPPIPIRGRDVIVVDDGAATGHSLLAALRSVRREGPARLAVAVAVAPPDTLRRLRRSADEVHCLIAPHEFTSVGEWFDDFSAVGDDAVVRALAGAESAAGGRIPG